MNVLIIYPFYNQMGLMHNFAAILTKEGVVVDSICYNNFYFEKNSSAKWPKFFLWGVKIFKGIKFSLIARCVGYIVKRYLLSQLFSKYDLIDFHAYYPVYNPLMRVCVKKGYKFDITLWGSDLMRANEERKRLLRFGFDRCRRIKMSENLHDVMQESYGTIYDEKSRIVYFGNSDLPVIDGLKEIETKEIKQKLYGDTAGKKIVVCGYNGISSQNHNEIIKALSTLNEAEKKSIHVVLPVTYGATKEYISSIRRQIERQSVSYTILDTFLESKEVAVIRKTADIVINVQNTDAIAGSLQDHLYCGNVCIFGEWLNYSPYTRNNIYYIKTTMGEIAKHLKDVLHQYEDYHNLCLGNHDKIKSIFSWESTIKNQIAVYGE